MCRESEAKTCTIQLHQLPDCTVLLQLFYVKKIVIFMIQINSKSRLKYETSAKRK